jgi:AGZA family xanthine/uracil permease-like MFS transporter
MILFIRKIRGSFLISMVITTFLAWITGFKPDLNQSVTLSLNPTWEVIQSLSFPDWGNLLFWSASFTLTLILIFENIGIIQGLLPNPSKFPRAYQASALSVISSGVFGTSPTICALESATGIADGGKTGLTSLTTGCLFLLAIPLIPIIVWIPDSAIASILMVVGGLMIQEVENISFKNLTEGIPAFVTFMMIPFTYNIPIGIAFGFLAYTILKLATGHRKELTPPFYILALIFILQLIFHI